MRKFRRGSQAEACIFSADLRETLRQQMDESVAEQAADGEAHHDKYERFSVSRESK